MKYIVIYDSGISRFYGDMEVEYMKVNIDGVGLYAEFPAIKGNEHATYEALKNHIIGQARYHKINPERLEFPNK